MGLMGSLYVGTSGLRTSQNALNTTAHNMANVDTIGYTRQQVQLGTRYYTTLSKTASANAWQQIGMGVNYSRVKQIRDYFLDKAYRQESGRQAFYDVSVSAIEEVSDLFRELEGESFSIAINNLWTSVQEIAKNPGDPTNQGVFIQRCNEFINRAKDVYEGLCEYQDDLNYKIKQQVDTINEYGREIAELNKKILVIESARVEQANDLRDARNQLVDELSAMGNLTLREDAFGNFLIQFEGVDFVKEDSANEIGLYVEDTNTGFYTPYWKQLADKTISPDGTVEIDIEGASVFKMNQVISTSTNTDIGSLKSMLFARGDHRATYVDIQDTEVYNKEISQSIMMNVMAEFDQLIHGVVTGINDVFEWAANRYEYPGSDYLRDSNGKPYQIFVLSADVDDGIGGKFFSVNNILINNELRQSPSLLKFFTPDEREDQELADKLKELFEAEDHHLNPNVKTPTNYANYYNNLISQVVNTASVMRGVAANQEVAVSSIYSDREQVLGVSSDEELSNMIMFQNAYNASSRYINVVSEMLEHIIATLGS